MTAKIRWGIIGCGDVTEVKSGPAFYRLPQTELVAVMRRNADLAADFARRHQVNKWYTNAQALIDDPNVDAVYIATPPSSHKEYTLLAAQAGKPVYVEKPMAINFQQCQEMIAACKTAQVPLLVAYYRRALPRFLQVKQLLDSQAIGIPRVVRCALFRPCSAEYQDAARLPWQVQPAIAGGGLFVDLACHTLDLLDFLLGEIVSVAGHASSQSNAYPAEDCVSMSFLFTNGVQGSGIWSFAAGMAEDHVEIIGSAGKIHFATFGDGPISYYNQDNQLTSFNFVNPAHIEMPMINLVSNQLLGKGSSPSTGESAARTNWVMDQVLAQYYR